MSVDVTITRAYKDPNFFSNLHPQSGYGFYRGGLFGDGGSGITAHNQLLGIQGGSPEYYHVTLDQWHYLTNLVDQMVLTSALDWIHSIETDDLILHGEIYFQNAGESSGGHDQRFIYWGDTGDVDTYLYEASDDELSIVCDSTLVMTFKSDDIEASVPLSIDTINELTGAVGVSFPDGIHADVINDISSAGIVVEGVTLLNGAGLFTSYVNMEDHAYFYTDSNSVWVEKNLYWGDTADFDTYIGESADDALRIVAGGTTVISLAAAGITLTSGATVNDIETTITDDDTHIPTSGAVVDYVAGVGIGYWDRSSAGELSPVTNGDDILFNGGSIYAADGVASNGDSLGIYAGDGDGSNSDGGDVIIKAGDGASAGGDADSGSIHLVPGQEYGTGTKGVIYLGSTSVDDSITFQVLSSDSYASLVFYSHGGGGIYFGEATCASINFTSVGALVSNVTGLTFVGTHDPLVSAPTGTAAHPDGRDLELRGGYAYSTGNNDGGHVYIYGGNPNGTGTIGGVYFGTGAAGTLQNDETETNVVGYDTATGKLSYMSVPEGKPRLVSKAQILYTNTTQTTIITLPAGAVIWDIEVEVVTAFTGTGTDLLDVGITGTGNRYEDDLDIASTGWKTLTLSNVPDRMTGSTAITFQYFDQNSDAGAGEAAVYIIYSLH